MNPEGADTQETQNTETADCEATEISATNEAAAADVAVQPDISSAVTAEVCIDFFCTLSMLIHIVLNLSLRYYTNIKLCFRGAMEDL